MADYAPASPDLNPINSVWTWMDRCVQKNYFNFQQCLRRLVEHAWNVIP